MAEKIFLTQRTLKHVVKRLGKSTITGEVIETGDGTTRSFVSTLAKAFERGSLIITATDINGVDFTLSDDSEGNLVGQYDVVLGTNDKLDFSEFDGIQLTATIAAGTYATGQALATEIQNKINAVGGTFGATYTCTYDGAINKFTISTDSTVVISTGVNDKIDFEETVGNELTATIAAGTYTLATLATAIYNALNAAGTSTYTVTALGNRLVIESSGTGGNGIFNLLWATGTNSGTSAALALGFDAADDTGSLKYTSDHGNLDLLWNSGSNSATAIADLIGYDDGSDDLYKLSYQADNESGGLGLDTNTIDYDTGILRYTFSTAIENAGNIEAEYDTWEYDSTVFGVYGTPLSDSSHLNFPWSITTDPSGNIYVVDGINNSNGRIVKLDSSLSYISELDVSAEIGRPYAIVYDASTGDLVVVGIYQYVTLSIARIPTTLASVSYFDNYIGAADTNDQPMGVSSGFVSGTLLISGMSRLLITTDSGSSFSDVSTQIIKGEESSKFLGHVMHPNGYLYLNAKRRDGSRLVKVDSSYENVGDSNKISKFSTYCFLGYNATPADIPLHVYDNDNQQVLRYNPNLNLEEAVFQNTGTAIAADCKEITGILHLDV